MKKETIFSIVILCVFVLIVYFLFQAVSHEILLGLFVGLIPSGILWHQQKEKIEREHHNWLLRDKEAYLSDIIDVILSIDSNEKQASAKIAKRMKHLQPALLARGSPSILRGWTELLEEISSSNSSEDTIRLAEKFVRLIRKKLGHNDSELKPGEVWATIMVSKERHIALDACKDETYE